MENNTNEVVEVKEKEAVKEEAKDNNISDAKVFIVNYNLTNKAKFLLKNGFVAEEFQVEKLDGMIDVSHNDGFKGYGVYTNTKGELFVAKPETDEEENIFSYNVTKLANTTDEEYKQLIKISNKTSKGSIHNIFKIAALCMSIFGTIGFIFLIIIMFISGGTIADIIVGSLELALPLATAFGVTAILFKKK